MSIWSDQNWSEIAKQFNKPIEFPLPGRTGVLSLERESDKKIKLQQLTEAKLTGSAKSYLNENLDYLLNRPLPKENQINALKEAVYYQNKMDNSLSNLEKLRSKNCFELKAFSCPISLVEGKIFLLFFPSFKAVCTHDSCIENHFVTNFGKCNCSILVLNFKRLL